MGKHEFRHRSKGRRYTRNPQEAQLCNGDRPGVQPHRCCISSRKECGVVPEPIRWADASRKQKSDICNSGRWLRPKFEARCVERELLECRIASRRHGSSPKKGGRRWHTVADSFSCGAGSVIDSQHRLYSSPLLVRACNESKVG